MTYSFKYQPCIHKALTQQQTPGLGLLRKHRTSKVGQEQQDAAAHQILSYITWVISKITEWKSFM